MNKHPIKLMVHLLSCTLLACGTTDLTGRPDTCRDPTAEDLTVEDVPSDDMTETEPSCEDHDGDGHLDESCGGDDCDDSDPAVYPGAPEVCMDGVDQDCDTVIDAFSAVTDEIVLAGDLPSTYGPAIAWTGSEFGVAWLDAGTREAPRVQLHLARLDARGLLVEDSTFLGGGEPVGTLMHRLGLAWTGSEFGVVWDAFRSDGDSFVSCIMFARVGADGMRVGDEVVVAGDPAVVSSWSASPTIAWTGSGFAIAYNVYEEVFISFLGPEGHRVGEQLQVTDWLDDHTYNSDPSIVWTGSEFGLIWSQYVYPTARPGFTRLASDGDKLLDDVIVRSISSSNCPPSIVWSGSAFAVGSSYSFATLDADGDPIADVVELHGAIPHRHEAHIYGPQAIVWTGSEYGLIAKIEWSHFYYYTVSPDGTEERQVIQLSTTNANGALDSALAWTGSTLGTVWKVYKEDWSLDDNGDIYFRLVGFCE